MIYRHREQADLEVAGNIKSMPGTSWGIKNHTFPDGNNGFKTYRVKVTRMNLAMCLSTLVSNVSATYQSDDPCDGIMAALEEAGELLEALNEEDA